MLEIKNLTVKVLNKEILKDFNLEIKEGEIHTIMGPNGVGKSTICKVLLGDDSYEVVSGKIKFLGKDITSLNPTLRSRMGMFLVNQNPIEIEGISNALMLRTALSEIKNEYIGIHEFNEEMKKACQKLNIPESFIHRGINERMSGGEKKKNELLQMWILKPKFIILDEVDSGLDVDSLKIVTKFIKDYLKENKASVLIITHHDQILKYLKPDYVHILKDKKIRQTGDASLAKKIEEEGFNQISKAFNGQGKIKDE